MRKLIAILAALIVSGLPASAGDLNIVKLSLSGVSTGTIPDEVSTDFKISGWVEGVYFDGPAAMTSNVSVVTSTNSTVTSVPTYTVLNVTNLSSDAWYFPAVKMVDNANSAVANSHRKVPFVDTKLTFVVTTMTGTNSLSYNCYIMYSK